MVIYTKILDFWFTELQPSQWWQKDPEFDAMINARFGQLHRQAMAGELFQWRETAQGSLAEIIILDQFSRNIYRNKPASFASDPLALALSQTAIKRGFDHELSQTQKSFLYLPFMHSESKLIHSEAVKLYQELDSANHLDFELKHKAIIDKFGRYPHRNEILGRQSTKEEVEFLNEPNSSF